jgi:hypothetical protein
MIVKSFLRLVTASTLAKAWAKKSPMWLTFAVVVMVIRLIDGRAAKKPAGKTAQP